MKSSSRGENRGKKILFEFFRLLTNCYSAVTKFFRIPTSFSCTDILDCFGHYESSQATCCGDIFNPKPFFTKHGVCFSTRPHFTIKTGIFQRMDYILVTANADSNFSSGVKFTHLNNSGNSRTQHDGLWCCSPSSSLPYDYSQRNHILFRTHKARPC